MHKVRNPGCAHARLDRSRLWPAAIDIALIVVFVGYAVSVLLLLRPGADALRLAALEAAGFTYRAVVYAAMALLVSASVDTFIALDMAFMAGRHAALAVTLGNLAALLILSVSVAVASRSRVPADPPQVAPAAVEATGDHETMAVLNVLLEAKRVYRDADLNLDRLARKAAVPARQISGAVNRTTGKNVSQYVNDFPIADACGPLAGTAKWVTEIMLEVGFQTKSSFNREFRRLTGMTPLAWRKTQALQS